MNPDRERRLIAERDSARNRIFAVCRAMEAAQRNGQTATSNDALCKALGVWPL